MSIDTPTSAARPAGRKRRRLIAIILAALAAAALVVSAAVASPSAASASDRKVSQSLTVKTAYGYVHGKRIGGAQAFLGLPFAKPPVYDLMFKSPVDVDRWSGVRDATRQGPACLQFQPTGVKNDQATSLDCLYLDVYRPAKVAKGKKLPVMVWYHGGGNTQGTGSIYGGQSMADRTNTIIVTTNYRLGAAGGLSLPALDAENPSRGSGNYAIEDQVQTLKWVQKTISSFGGDKNNVTIFGQSAGGAAACNMLASPLATGLFDKAIIQSFFCSATGTSIDTQRARSVKFVETAGCSATDPDVLTCIRNAWPAALVTAYQTAPVSSGVVGTLVLPQASGAAIASGTWNKVPIIIGNVRYESKLLDLARVGITAEEYTQYVIDRFGEASGALVLEKYPLSDYSGPYLALASLDTDAGFACAVNTSANLLRDKTTVYRYEFNDPTSPTLFGFQPEGIDMSNAHSAELQYLFDFTLGDKPLTATQERLANAMQDYWAAFARTGNPNVRWQPAWPSFSATGLSIVLGPQITTSAAIDDEHNCDFFAQLPPKP